MLDGITVLDLSSVGPASRASRWLADYGATVVKVGPTASRAGVLIDPPFYSYGAGRGLKRIRLDLKSPGGLDAFLRLAERSDVLIESFRPGVAERIGIGYAALSERNPGLVYCSTSGYGQSGPYSQWAGHDINYLALGGFLDCSTARADGGPPIPGATVADSAGGGMHALVAILAALVRRAGSGEGTHLDVCAADAVLALMSQHIDEYLSTGVLPGPGSNILTGRFACYDCYRTRDGKWLAVGAIEPHFYANLCKALGLEQYIPYQEDDARQDEIREAFRAAFAERDRDDWVAELAPANTCVSPVYSVPELIADPHYRERGVFCSANDAERGEFELLAPVFAGSRRDLPVYQVRPKRASDTDEFLRYAGLSAAEIEELRTSGAAE
ncbi:MAG: CoA transferase [Proteobacteria bacterium]|nr:CoA transferase [Pseudomonadota bacterium]